MRFTETNPVRRLAPANRFRLMFGLPLLPQHTVPPPFMDYETFSQLCDWIEQQAGVSPDEAAAFASEIGDTPDTDADGNWTATVNARTINIQPMP